MRNYLCPGTELELNHDGVMRKYRIDKVIGDGATCIVYEAHRADGVGIARNYRIKECYPYDAQIKRCGKDLFWANEKNM